MYAPGVCGYVRVGPVCPSTRALVASALLFVEHAGADQGIADGVGIAVAAGPPVLQIALLLLGDTTGNADADVSIGNPSAKVMNVAGLALAGQPALVVLPSARIVRLDVPEMLLAELVDRFLDLSDTVFVAHRLRREVGVGTGAIPRAVYRFRVQGDDHTVFFSDAVQNESSDPQIVSSVDARARSHLDP